MRIDQIPTEIVARICENVPAVDVLNVRLTSRFLSNVANPFLLDEIHLIFKRDSFQRLLDISRHPVISRAVTKLLYEFGSLPTFEDRRGWESRIIDPMSAEILRRFARRGACKEEQRAITALRIVGRYFEDFLSGAWS